jgi:hypothetical protein
MDEFVVCTNPGCGNVLQAEIVQRYDTGGWCMACVRAKKEVERAAYVKANRRSIDPFAGLDDPVEQIKVIHQDLRSTELLVVAGPPRSPEDIYSTLSQDDLGRLVSFAIDELRTGSVDLPLEIARCLAAFTNADLHALQNELFRQVDGGEIWAFNGGVAYSFTCDTCSTVAVTCQTS